MSFDWTISLGSLLSMAAMVITVIGSLYRVVTNHLKHLSEKFDMALRSHTAQEQEFLSQRFDSIETDIRQLRDWVVAIRDKR